MDNEDDTTRCDQCGSEMKAERIEVYDQEEEFYLLTCKCGNNKVVKGKKLNKGYLGKR